MALARQALGTTSPNPAVGALIVKKGIIVGQGFTLSPGQAHAEIIALNKAGEEAQDATLYTSLEPCCLHGRTPPCTKAIIVAGIREVHIATLDPNPKVQGRGRDELEAEGIKVFLGEGEEEARELYEAFAKHVRLGIPFVVAKYAMSLDGKIATHTGQSQWITGEAGRNFVQELRRAADGIMVGVKTVMKDNPRLTARDEEGRPLKHQPLRVVVDSNASTPAQARLLKEPGKTLIATINASAMAVASLEAAGSEVLKLPSHGGRVDLKRLLKELGRRDVVSLLVEGGGTLLGSLFDLGLVDKVVAFISPIIIGGRDAPSPVEGRGTPVLRQAVALKDLRVEQVGSDLLIRGYPMPRD